jgi:steroid delta-isomerase-like uncharacterized protein
MALAENKAVIGKFVEEVLNQGRLERADELVALDFVELDPLPGQQPGREGLKQVIAAFRTAFPDIHWVIEEMVAEGDKVFSRFTWNGTHRGEFFGVPATGKQITVKGAVIDRVLNGQMVDSRILMDGLGMMTQLGVVPQDKAST